MKSGRNWGRLGMKFDITQLCDVDIEVIDGDRGKNYPHQDELFDSGYCLFLSAKNVTQNGFLFGDNQFITQEKDELLNNGNLIRGDIVITTRGTVGNVAIYSDDVPFDNIRINSGMLIIRCGNNIDNYFLYQVLRSKWFYNQIISIQSGSAQPQLPKSHFLKMTIPMPDMETQRKIAVVLSRLGDKISVNTAINENLEQQAQAIFKSWFGADIENLNPSNCKSLGELVTSVDNRGKTPPLSNEKTEYPIIDVRALSGSGRIINFSNCTKYVEEETYNNWFRNGHPKDYDILISTVGSLAEMKIYLGNIGCIAQNVVGFRSKGLSPIYLYQYLNYIRKELVSYNIGSVQPSIKVTHIIKHPIFIPENDKIEKFDMLIKDYTLKIYNNCCENKRLVELRDTLLPKLMKGEIDVSEVKI